MFRFHRLYFHVRFGSLMTQIKSYNLVAGFSPPPQKKMSPCLSVCLLSWQQKDFAFTRRLPACLPGKPT